VTHIGAVPEGAAAEEAEAILAHPIVRARKQWLAMSGCDKPHIENQPPCSNCGGAYWQVFAQRAYERAEDEERAGQLE
jgi:hypothetical protein